MRREELGILALNTDEAEGERRTGKGYQREKTGKPCSLRPTTEPLSQLRGSKVCSSQPRILTYDEQSAPRTPWREDRVTFRFTDRRRTQAKKEQSHQSTKTDSQEHKEPTSGMGVREGYRVA